MPFILKILFFKASNGYSPVLRLCQVINQWLLHKAGLWTPHPEVVPVFERRGEHNGRRSGGWGIYPPQHLRGNDPYSHPHVTVYRYVCAGNNIHFILRVNMMHIVY